MTPPEADVTAGRSLSIVWLVPLIALLIGGWMVYQHWQSQGPLVQLTFATADGIEAGKTAIRTHNVQVGRVQSVELNKQVDGVIVSARIEPEAAHLLKENSLFWVVRPRIGTAGISGLDTLVSGSYIELRPGDSSVSSRAFAGLEQPPVTPPGTPGIRLSLTSKTGGSLSVGDSVTYRGHNVGQIEQAEFDTERRQMAYDLFIRAPFDSLVRTGTRFWNVSGINITTSASGVKISTGSLDTVLTGGVAFDVPEDQHEGVPAEDGASYQLYASEEDVTEHNFLLYTEFLLLFEQSIRGLEPGAPVEFRGIRVGTVSGLYNRHNRMIDPGSARIPVSIRLEPGRFGEFDLIKVDQEVRQWIRSGMRASLKQGNLLTGSLYIDLDIYPDEETVALEQVDGVTVIPTVSVGLQRIEQRAIAVLEKLEALPIEPVLVSTDKMLVDTRSTVKQLEKTLASIDRLVASKEVRNIPPELSRTLENVRESMQGFAPDSPLYHEMTNAIQSLRDVLNKLEPVLETLNEKPSALIFDQQDQPDPLPGAGK